jgi:hypothetical protein
MPDMKKLVFLITVCMFICSCLSAQVKTDSSLERKKIPENQVSDPDIKVQQSQARQNIAKITPADTVIITPVFRYEHHSDSLNKSKRAFISNDTIITPTMRHYPLKKKE